MRSGTIPKDKAPPFGEIYEEFRTSMRGHAVGAIVTFTGTVREDAKEHGAGATTTRQILIEAIEGVSSEHLQRIAAEAAARPGIEKVTIVHLTGTFEIGEPMVHVLVGASHRDEGFKAIEDVVTRYKKETPLWKKEIYTDGTSRWITH
ncbi:MAG: molybdenum cofactor biosynthesis protein MoaE [Candidatus Lokiarchaeota archaeon]|nr:molybdenum cofactor biosynthesis protein MoaE [Candidatus Lokiarchaeota archaeon]